MVALLILVPFTALTWLGNTKGASPVKISNYAVLVLFSWGTQSSMEHRCKSCSNNNF